MLESLNYSYDATGNRISMNRQSISLPLRGEVTSTNYNEANQMLRYNASSDNIGYDENGNMTSVTNGCGTTNYTWDVRNRLIGISGFNTDCYALSASFKYDALGRRIEKTINSVTKQYLYDGLDIVQEIENSVVAANYIRTLNIDEPLARVKADGSVRYYQQDALGSVIALTDDTGAVKTQYSYDSFGAVSISGEASNNPFQYTGRENDNTGLYYYRARYYSPELQRYVSEDPIRLRGGINFYRYVGNSPVNYIDPLGLAKCILEGCRYTQSVRKNYSEWEFMFSRIEGPEPGMIFPIYYLECWWKRRVTMTIGMAETCTYRCYDDCGGSYTYTTTKIYEGYTRTYTETRGTARSFFIWDALALVLPDAYCKQYLRP